MKQKQKHTPTPWSRDINAICGPNRHHMAVAIGEDGDNFATQVANAVLIVRAVNSHAALIEALESVVEFWAGGDCPPELWERMLSTLAAAKGE